MQFAAIDTHFLLALERGNPECQDAFDCLPKLKFFPVITGTVARSLAHMSENASDEEAKRIAKNTIIHIPTFVILDRITGYDGKATEMADVLLAGPLQGHTETEACIVAEAINENCELLVTIRDSLISKGQEIAAFAQTEHEKRLFVVGPAAIIEARRIVESAQVVRPK